MLIEMIVACDNDNVGKKDSPKMTIKITTMYNGDIMNAKKTSTNATMKK